MRLQTAQSHFMRCLPFWLGPCAILGWGSARHKMLAERLCPKIACFWPTGGGQSRCVYVGVCV
jgi:hypothetical protein